MTPVQRKILRLMLKHIADGAGVPTITWIAQQLGRARPVVHEHIRKMVAAGVLKATRKVGAYRRYVPADVCPTCGRPLNAK